MQTYTNQRGQTFGLKKGFYHDKIVPMDKGTAFSTPQYLGLSGKSRDILTKIQLGQKVSNREIRHLRGSMFVANGGNLGEEFAGRARNIDFLQHMRNNAAYGLERARLDARNDAMYGDGASESPTLHALNRDALIAEARQRSLAEDVAAMRAEEMRREQGYRDYYDKNILPFERARMKDEALLAADDAKYRRYNEPVKRSQQEEIDTLEHQKKIADYSDWTDSRNEARIAKEKSRKDLQSRLAAARQYFYNNIDRNSPNFEYFNTLFQRGGNEEFLAESIGALQENEEKWQRRLAENEQKYAMRAEENMRKTYYNILKNLRERNDKLSSDLGKRSDEELVAEANSLMDGIYGGVWRGASQGANPQGKTTGGESAVSREQIVADVNRRLKAGEITETEARKILSDFAKGDK